MKRIAIIGAGITGLRAALELCQDPEVSVTLWEKSASVGGRVATRRYGDKFVNHGITHFDLTAQLIEQDPSAQFFEPLLSFKNKATELPKAMAQKILELNSSVIFTFNQRPTKIELDGTLWVEDSKHAYDHVLITAPLPQVNELLQSQLHPEVQYSKKILFIGLEQNQVKRLELSDDFSERHFDDSDEVIREAAEKELKQKLDALDLKKWRYCQVLQGVPQFYTQVSERVTLAGDAFDPSKRYDFFAAWMSGLKAARKILD